MWAPAPAGDTGGGFGLDRPPLASAAQQGGAKKVNHDAVYTTTNEPSGNSVIVFTRAANGTLTQRKMTPDGKLLFVVNAGDNSVSSFLITPSGAAPTRWTRRSSTARRPRTTSRRAASSSSSRTPGRTGARRAGRW